MTNYHVVADAQSVSVALVSGEVTTTIVGVDPSSDLAVLHIETESRHCCATGCPAPLASATFTKGFRASAGGAVCGGHR